MKNHCVSSLIIRFLLASTFIPAIPTFIFAQNFVSTYAGTGTSGLDNGDTATCTFKAPFGMCSDNAGNIFIADQDNNCIRKITPSGIVSTYAGTGTAGYADGLSSLAQFKGPIDVCSDDSGNIYVSDFTNQYIRKISFDGLVSTIAGNGVAGYVDGAASSAEFNYPRGICRDQQGNLYIGDSWNHRIRKISADGQVSTYAGGGNIFGVQSVSEFKDGPDTTARFYTPCGLSIDATGNIFVADAYNHRVRKIDLNRVVTTVAGSGASGSAAGGFADGDTSIARFNTPTELFVNAAGEIFVGDTYNQRVRLVNEGTVSTIAGNGTAGLVNGIDSLAEFNRPRGLVMDATGSHLYISDNLNRVIRKITLAVETGTDDPATESNIIVFPNPSSGIIYVSGNTTIDKIKVSDLIGKEVFSLNYFQNAQELHLEYLTPGIYLLSVYLENTPIRTVKIVINN